MTNETIDEGIFLALQQDGRASFSDLARRLGIPRAVVAARFGELTAFGGLRIAAAVHPRVLGFDAMARLAVETSLPTAEVAAPIKDMGGCHFLSLATGRAGIVAEFTLPSIADLYERIDQIRRLPGVERVDTHIYREIAKSQLISTAPPAPGITIDQTDLGLIAILQEDGRAGFNALGNAVGLSTNGARTRVMRLISSNVIRIAATRLRTGSLAVGFGIRTSGLHDDAVAFFSALPGAEFVATCIGRYDFIATVVLETASQSLNVRDDALRLPSVRSVDSWVHTSIIHERYERTFEPQTQSDTTLTDGQHA
ncbi:Lrp/AsnC family transcriptional regulator [Arthrobacter sp. MMS24-S77]